MKMTHKQATMKMIVEHIIDRVEANNRHKPKKIIKDFQMEYDVKINYHKLVSK